MKTNKLIENQTNRLITIGLILLPITAIYLVIRIVSIISYGDHLLFYSIGLVGAILVLLNLLETKIGLYRLYKMSDSMDFVEFIKANEFIETTPYQYKTKMKGYYVLIANNVHFIFNWNTPPKGLFIDVFCDTSDLNKKQFKEIKKAKYTSTQFSIRKHSTNIFTRFDPAKIKAHTEGILKVVEKYNLDKLDINSYTEVNEKNRST